MYIRFIFATFLGWALLSIPMGVVSPVVPGALAAEQGHLVDHTVRRVAETADHFASGVIRIEDGEAPRSTLIILNGAVYELHCDWGDATSGDIWCSYRIRILHSDGVEGVALLEYGSGAAAYTIVERALLVDERSLDMLDAASYNR